MRRRRLHVDVANGRRVSVRRSAKLTPRRIIEVAALMTLIVAAIQLILEHCFSTIRTVMQFLQP